MRGRKEEIGIQKHIRIMDADIKSKLDCITELPKYKSFNRAVNDALFYGVPVLCEKLFGEVKGEWKFARTEEGKPALELVQVAFPYWSTQERIQPARINNFIETA